MLLGPSDCPCLRFNVLSIDYVRVTSCFYDYDYIHDLENFTESLKAVHNFFIIPLTHIEAQKHKQFSLSALTVIFPGEPGLHVLLKLIMMEVVVTTAAISRAKLHQIVTTNKPTPNFLQAGMPFLSPNQQCQSTEAK